MTEQQVNRALGEPWWSAQIYENSDYRVSVMNRTVRHIHSKGGGAIDVGHLKGKDHIYIDGKEVTPDDPRASARFSWPIHTRMTPVEIGAIMGAPTEDCRDYRGDALTSLKICFKNGRVVSKKLADQPPT